jgi:hypothetical protein
MIGSRQGNPHVNDHYVQSFPVKISATADRCSDLKKSEGKTHGSENIHGAQSPTPMAIMNRSHNYLLPLEALAAPTVTRYPLHQWRLSFRFFAPSHPFLSYSAVK